LRAFQSLASRAEACKATQLEADAFNNAGLIYWRWGQYAQALRAFKRAVPLRRQAADYFGLCASLMNIGVIQEQLGEVAPARRSYRSALRLAEKTGYVQALAAVENNLSNIERRTGLLSAALEHAVRAIEFSRNAGDPNLESIAEETPARRSPLMEIRPHPKWTTARARL